MGSAEIVHRPAVVVTDDPQERTLINFNCPFCGYSAHVCASCCDWGCEYKLCVNCYKEIPLEWVEESKYPDGYYTDRPDGKGFYYKMVNGEWHLISRRPHSESELVPDYSPYGGEIRPVSWLEVHKSMVSVSIEAMEALIEKLRWMKDNLAAESTYAAEVKKIKGLLLDIVSNIDIEKL